MASLQADLVHQVTVVESKLAGDLSCYGCLEVPCSLAVAIELAATMVFIGFP